MKPALTDALQQSIASVGAPGNLAYTERQLYYELCRVMHPQPGLAAHHAALLAGAGVLPALLLRRRPGAIGLALGNLGAVVWLWLAHALPYTNRVPLPYAAFQEVLTTHRLRRGEPPGLLPKTPPPPPGVQAGADEPDLLDYGLEYVLICQSSAIAAMLLANMAHMTIRAAILPLEQATPLPEVLHALLARTPGARVCFLHDASLQGLHLAATLAPRLCLPATAHYVPIGLRPVHAMRLHLFALPLAPPNPHDLPALPTGEQHWLRQGWQAEVAAVPPADLLLKLRRIVAGTVPATRPWYQRFSLQHERQIGFMTWPER